MIIQNWLEIHNNKTCFYSVSQTRKLKINWSAKSVEAFSQPWINFLGILRMIVKTKGSVKSLLKLLSGEIISRTYVNNFFYSQKWIKIMKILPVQIDSYKNNYMMNNM